MQNESIADLETLIGDWDVTLSGAWFLDDLNVEQHGQATFSWIGDAFVVMTSSMDGEPTWDFAFGHSDADDDRVALYHDNRGVARVFAMQFDGETWTMERRNRDFYQRFIASIEPDTITGRWEASDDEGGSWRKDFDLTFRRRRSTS